MSIIRKLYLFGRHIFAVDFTEREIKRMEAIKRDPNRDKEQEESRTGILSKLWHPDGVRDSRMANKYRNGHRGHYGTDNEQND